MGDILAGKGRFIKRDRAGDLLSAKAVPIL
jgi:hypothetical protein